MKEVRRTRMDPTLLLYDQIALPIVSIPTNQPMSVCWDCNHIRKEFYNWETQLCKVFFFIQAIFSKEVVRIFQSLKAGQIFVDLCLSLPVLKSFTPESTTIQSDSVKSFFTKVISSRSFR